MASSLIESRPCPDGGETPGRPANQIGNLSVAHFDDPHHAIFANDGIDRKKTAMGFFVPLRTPPEEFLSYPN
jgi:hypothetical protein